LPGCGNSPGIEDFVSATVLSPTPFAAIAGFPDFFRAPECDEGEQTHIFCFSLSLYRAL
jgi:hypothetical protein